MIELTLKIFLIRFVGYTMLLTIMVLVVFKALGYGFNSKDFLLIVFVSLINNINIEKNN